VTALVPEFDDYLRPDETRQRFAPLAQAEIVGVAGAKHLWVGFADLVLDEVVRRVAPSVAVPCHRPGTARWGRAMPAPTPTVRSRPSPPELDADGDGR
jgi:hypothetical protein